MATSVSIRLLGGFDVEVDGRAVPGDSWRSRRAADVVKLLSLEEGQSLHRELLMAALWPELSDEAASANLRKAVHFARRALGSDRAIEYRGPLLHLWPEASLDIDLIRFEREASAAIVEERVGAAVQVAGSFDEELLPADRYEPWAQTARRKATELFRDLLHAAEAWDRLLERDPTDEVAHRALIQMHVAAGNRGEAIRQFTRLRDALREHFGVGPDVATVALYEQALAMEGAEPPTPAERAAALLAHGLVAWGRQDLAEAEHLAREARALARDAELGHELGEASTLLALVAYARGTWHDLFREEFADSVRRPASLEQAVYDAHLCFQEFYLYGSEGNVAARAFARELFGIARSAGSVAGAALSLLLLGELALLSGDLDDAVRELGEAARSAEEAGCGSVRSCALERLAEAEAARGNDEVARDLLAQAGPLARASAISSHLVTRVFAVRLLAATSVVDRLRVTREGERWMADAARVCEPCSMSFRVEAARSYARAGNMPGARHHLDEAERIANLWQGGPWTAAVWEVRAEMREAEGNVTQAAALQLEAAESFAALNRPLEERRCRAAASRLSRTTPRP